MKQKTRILIIDDELLIRNMLKTTLATEGYQISEAVDGKSGLNLVADFRPHLVILDLGLPDMNGAKVIEQMRTWTRVPTIILTASRDENTKVRLLDAGADDYLTKPFGANELLARVRVALRNIGYIEATPRFKSRDLEIDLARKKVTVASKVVKLTTTEWEVLVRLVRDSGKVVTLQQLLKQVWPSSKGDDTHYVRIYINQLRKHLEANPSDPKHILTEPGVGYRLV